MEKEIKELKRLVESGACTFAASKDSAIIKASGTGVGPIIERMREDRNCLKGFRVADRVIGKAAALLLALSGARFVYGALMSKTAQSELKSNNVPFEFGRETEYIQNRDKTGMCPLEKAVANTNDPSKAYFLIEKKIAELMRPDGN